MQGAALSSMLPGEPGGREQMLTRGSSLHCFPLGHAVHPDLSDPVLISPTQSCQAHHGARAGAMYLLAGCCPTDIGVILKSRALGD